MMTLLAFVLTSLSLAQPAGSGRDIAQTAMRLEIKRDRLAVTPDKLRQMFNDACSGGYQLACDRNTWLDDGEPSPRRVRDTFRPDCETNDAVACMAYAWAMIQLGDEPKQSEDDRDITYRTVMRVQRNQCEVRGNASACKDIGDLVYGEKGVSLDDPAKAAAVFWDRACDRGEYAACTQVARLMLEGRRIRGKRRSAYDYVKPACDGGYVDGCFLLAQINQEKWDIARRDTVYGDLCRKGHVESCYSLARSYFTGEFPEPSPGRAQELFQLACGLEHARSCFEAGRGTDDLVAAEDYFREACELDDAAGCKALVDRILEWGQPGAVKDNYKAFEKACDQRQSEQACEWLAQHLLDPDAQERDYVRGRALLEQVCVSESSSPKACFKLGECFENKIGGSRDRTDAVKYYRWACGGGVLESCLKVGELREAGIGVPRDDAEALVYFGKACDGELSVGCARAGKVLRYSVQIPRDKPKAAEWYRKGCDMKDPASCLGLGQVLETGINGAPNLEEARVAYQLAINEGLAEAKTHKAYLLWNGLGGKKSKKQARELCREACGEDADACEGPEKLTGAVEPR